MEYMAHQVAEKIGVSVPTLHYYEKAGLLPEIKRDFTKKRLYSDSDIEWLRMIILMRKIDIPIQAIRRYVQLLKDGPDTIAKRYEFVIQYREMITQKIAAMQSSMKWLNAKVDFYQEMLEGEHRCESFEEEAEMFRRRIGMAAPIGEMPEKPEYGGRKR